MYVGQGRVAGGPQLAAILGAGAKSHVEDTKQWLLLWHAGFLGTGETGAEHPMLWTAMIRAKFLACLLVMACVWSGGIDAMAGGEAYAQSGGVIRQIRVIGNKRIEYRFRPGGRPTEEKADTKKGYKSNALL